MRRTARRVRIVCPDVEADLLAAPRLQRAREAEQLPHEGERAPARVDLPHLGRDVPERRSTPGDHEVVAVNGLHGGSELIHHPSIPTRREGLTSLVLRVQKRADVGLVPRLPVADAREVCEGAAVAQGGGFGEAAEFDGIRAYASVRSLARSFGPVRSGVNAGVRPEPTP